MTVIYMNGYELGTSNSECQILSQETWTDLNITDSSTYSASSTGIGRSRKLNATNNLASTTTPSRFGAVALTFPSVQNQVNLGFRAALSGTLPANNSAGNMGLLATQSASALTYFMGFARGTAAVSSNYPLTANSNSSSGAGLGSTAFVVTDNNMHQYTIASYISGANRVFNLYIDKNLVGTWSAASFNYPTSMILYMGANNGGAAVGNRANIWSEIDDVYVSVNEDPLGDLIVYRTPGDADVQAQWTRYGGSASDAAAVDRIDLGTTTGIRSNTAGAADLYSIADPNSALPRRRIYAAKTTVYGTGDGSATVTPTQKSGSTTVSGTAKALSVFGDVADTGWDSTLANTPMQNFQFGVTRS